MISIYTLISANYRKVTHVGFAFNFVSNMVSGQKTKKRIRRPGSFIRPVLIMTIFDDTTTRRANERHRPDEDFSRAIQKAFMEDLMGLFRGKSCRLLPFAKVKEDLEISLATDRGIQTVPLDAIVGSEERYACFSRQFLPLKENLRERWMKIDAARQAGHPLPPVELYKVKDAYFVKDGHHRISVARTRGTGYIEARVIEYACEVPLDKDTDLDKLAVQQTYLQFLKETRLHQQRPGVDLQLTLLGGYLILMEHIQVHRYHQESRLQAAVSLPEAACSWYDRVYQPLAAIIREHRIIKRFKHRTVTDFYIWMVVNRHELMQTFLSAETARGVVAAYTRKYDTRFRKLLGVLRRWLGMVKYR